MATLAGNSIASSYTSLLKLNGNTDSTAAGNGSNAIQVKTGDDDATPLFLNTDRVGIGVQPYSPLHIKSDAEGSIGGLEATDGTFIPQVIIEGSGTTAAKMSPTLALFNSSTGADGDTLGSIMFIGGDDSNQPPSTIAEGSVYAGILAKITDETNSSNDGEVFSTSQNDETLDEALRIDSSGNVGIGISPVASQKLHVKASSDINFTVSAVSSALRINAVNDAADATAPLEMNSSSTKFLSDVSVIKGTTSSTQNVMGVGKAGNIEGSGGGSAFLTVHGNTANQRGQIELGSDNLVGDGTSMGRVFFYNLDGGSSVVSRAQITAMRDDADDASKLVFATEPTSGDVTDNFVLDGNSRISLSNNDASAGNTIFGYQAMNVAGASASHNVAIGNEAMHDVGTSQFNVAVGSLALTKEVNGDRNVAIGYQALYSQSNSGLETTENVGVGIFAGFTNVTGSRNTYVGANAGFGTSSGSTNNNTGIGYSSLTSVSTGGSNTSLGAFSGDAITTGSSNTFIGLSAGSAVTTQSQLTAIGQEALAQSNGATASIAIGYRALYGTNAGVCSDNIAIGNSAMVANMTHVTRSIAIGTEALNALVGASTPTDNIGIGYRAGNSITNSSSNIAIGGSAMGEGGGNAITGGSNTAIGTNAMYNAEGAVENNVAVGANALLSVTTGSNNTVVGRLAADALTTGNSNIVIGDSALGTATTATLNVAIGGDCMSLVPASVAIQDVVSIGQNAFKGSASTTDGADGTVAIGRDSLKSLTTGARNVSIGYTTLQALTSGSNNTAVGHEALYTSVDGSSNTAIGRKTLYTFEGGSDAGENTAVGALSSFGLTTGVSNVSVGKGSLANGTTASANVAIGTTAMGLGVVTGAGYNVAVGQSALYDLTSGTSNIALGAEAAQNLTTGVQNVVIGRQALNTSTNTSNAVIIGLYAGLDINSTAADGSVLIGRSAGENITNGARNTAIGFNAMLDSIGAGDNTVVGYEALKEGTTAERQTAVGVYALGAASAAALTGNENTAVGYKALTKLQGSSLENTAIGSLTLENCTTGQANTTLGYATMAQCVDTNNCVAIGRYAMGAGDVAGDGQVAVGYGALGELTGGTKNTSLGYQAGNLITTGDTNIVIGYDADVDNNNRNGCIIIGCELTLNTASDNVVEIGNDTNSMTYDLDGGDITVTSDVRTKMNIEDSKIGLDFINSLRPVTYETKPSAEYPKEFGVKNPVKKKSGKRWDGLIAQEVKQVMDDMGVEFSGWSEGLNTKQTLAYGKLIMPLIKSVQELSAKVEELEAKLK